MQMLFEKIKWRWRWKQFYGIYEKSFLKIWKLIIKQSDSLFKFNYFKSNINNDIDHLLIFHAE